MMLEKYLKVFFSSVRWFNRHGRGTLRKHAHAINRDFSSLKIENFQLKIFDIFLIFAQNIDCGYMLEPPRRGGSVTSTHSLCFGAKIRRLGIPLQTFLYKRGV